MALGACRQRLGVRGLASYRYPRRPRNLRVCAAPRDFAWLSALFCFFFGLSWLRKAILRFSGRKALHDERAIFEKRTSLLAAETAAHTAKSDRIAFATAFNAVLLEGLEVAIIVVTFTATYGMRGLVFSGVGAAAAFALVCTVGVILREPCSRVPENTMKFVVGIMLTSFGILWGGEGVGIAWPFGDLSFLGIAGALLLFSAGAVRIARIAS